MILDIVIGGLIVIAVVRVWDAMMLAIDRAFHVDLDYRPAPQRKTMTTDQFGKWMGI